jgi:hypothetical protein
MDACNPAGSNQARPDKRRLKHIAFLAYLGRYLPTEHTYNNTGNFLSSLTARLYTYLPTYLGINISI